MAKLISLLRDLEPQPSNAERKVYEQAFFNKVLLFVNGFNSQGEEKPWLIQKSELYQLDQCLKD